MKKSGGFAADPQRGKHARSGGCRIRDRIDMNRKAGCVG